MAVWYAGWRSEQIALIHVNLSLSLDWKKLNALRFQNGLIDQQPQEQGY